VVDKTTTEAVHTRARRRAPRFLAIAVTGVLLGSLTVLAGSDPASGRTVVNAGSSQDHIVSADAFRIQVVAIGADGGSTASAVGGNGARVTTTIPVTPGETLRIFVNEGGGAGGNGSALPVGEDGALGGGASGIRRAGVNQVIAAGGGGAGGDALLTAVAGAGDGGSAPLANSSGGCAPGTDGNDATLPPVTAGGGGGGGQCNAGGVGGVGAAAGTDGSANQGGTGGTPAVAGAGGGGGGAGHFGGGGGGAGVAGVLGGGGGGGGSSFIANGTGNQIVSNGAATTGSVMITELVGDTECSDEVDNDGDGPIDSEDPGCHTDADENNPDSYDPNDDSETNTQCSNGVDDADVEDTLVDAADPGCHTDGDATDPDTYNPADNNEGNSAGTGNNGQPQCSDGADNDDPEDTLADTQDPGCHTDGDATNAASYDADDDNEVNGATPQCSDNVDNADPEDTLVDEQDPGCHTDGNADNAASYRANDDNESNAALDDEGPAGSESCRDGVDNDGDGLIDANDPGCQGGTPGGGGGLSDLTVRMDANKASVKKGKTVGFTVTVRNNGPAVARNVEVTTKLDKGKLAFKGVTGNGCTAPAPASNIVVCRITSLPVGQSVNFTIEAKTKGGGKAKVETQALLTEGDDRAPSDNVDREKIRIKPRGGRRR
jgi:uncharacterized repeat protein (TIGR01451 family)